MANRAKKATKGKEESRSGKKDDEEICREEVDQEDYGEARSRQRACQEGQGGQISGTQAGRQEGDRQGAGQETGCSGVSHRAGRVSGTEAGRVPSTEAGHSDCRRAKAVGAVADCRRSGVGPNRTAETRCASTGRTPGFACGTGAGNAGRTSRAEAVPAVAECRRPGAGLSGTAVARGVAASSTPGFACGGAGARTAGRATPLPAATLRRRIMGMSRRAPSSSPRITAVMPPL